MRTMEKMDDELQKKIKDGFELIKSIELKIVKTRKEERRNRLTFMYVAFENF